MLKSGLNTVRGLVLIVVLALNLFFWGTPFILGALIKLFVPIVRMRRGVVGALAWLGERWSMTTWAIINLLLPTKLLLEGEIPADRRGHYLLLSNHCSWIDILAILQLFTGRLPFIRFFLKQELIWVPVVGIAAWALDFPFMKRHSAEYLALHPEKRGSDLATTRKACQRYRHMPVTILNFLEGTRFSEEKRLEQESPYRHLLRPRVGGISYVLATLGDQLDGVFDISIAYPGAELSLWRWATARVPEILIRVRPVAVPAEFLSERITEPTIEREHFKEWLAALWEEKDEWLEQVAQATAARSAASRKTSM